MSASFGLSPEQIEIFATGLFYVANRDGINAAEERMLREFLDETKSGLSFEELPERGFSALEAAQVLSTTYIRRIFLKSAIAMTRVDGIHTYPERQALGEIADAFGMTHVEYGDLEHQAIQEAALLA